MTNPASVSDLQARFFRDLTPRELAIAQQWLDDAYEVLLGRRASLEADVVAGTVKESTIVRVVVGMVSRVFSNPDGKLEEHIDDYSYRRDSLVSSGALHLTSDELADITPGRAVRRSVRLTIYGTE